MLFHSTRGYAPETDIRSVALTGLAPDGGLYLPKVWPRFSQNDIAAMKNKSYGEIAFHVLRPFLQSAIDDVVLGDIIQKSYAAFDDPSITPLKQFGGLKILELFHGPTLAFKDVALQFLGHTLDYFMQGAGQRLTVIGATSGDTGSAAIAALAGCKHTDLFILYPAKGPSEIQRKQMTCVDAPNVHAIAIDGSFDDCQAIVKSLLADEKLSVTRRLTTVNSINLLRILAQVVYYFVAARDAGGSPSFAVPTGNFGDVFAGYAAMKCGLPIGKLIVASNSNDILTRFFASGRMEPGTVHGTLSPSMDIQISSNFERLLFDLCGGRADDLRNLMQNKGRFEVSSVQLAKAKEVFLAGKATDAETLETISDVHKQYGYLLDPHSAVGVRVALDLRDQTKEPLICLATAHPAKFPETVERATGIRPSLPVPVVDLINKPERIISLPCETARIAGFIKENGL